MAVNLKPAIAIKDSENKFNGKIATSKNQNYVPKKTVRPAFRELSNKINNKNKNEENPKLVTQNKCGADDKLKKKKNICILKNNKIEETSKTDVTKMKKPAILENNSKNIEETETRKSYSSQHRVGILDIDTADKHDLLLLTEYVKDIFNYLYELENTYPINKNFLEAHKTTPKMRSILVNWIVEVHLNFHFLPETLHLSISVVDRYLQVNKKIGRETLQLVGTAAMFIASKYEEMYVPSIEDFVYVCDDTFTKTQIYQMEIEVLSKLNFTLCRPLAIHFLRRYNKAAQVQQIHHCLGKYLIELALLEYEMCHIKPSQQAAAACCLSICILNEVLEPSKVWTKTLIHYSRYEFTDIESTIKNYAQLLSKTGKSKQDAIKTKYASCNNCKISLNPKLKGPVLTHILSTPASVP